MSEASMSPQRSRLPLLRRMRSPRVFWGGVCLLALVPLTALYQRLFPVGVSTFSHWLLTLGCLLIALGVFDFRRLPAWANRLGFAFLAVEAVVFFIQGLADLLRDEGLRTLAYQGLGQQLEAGMLWLFILVWGGTLLLRDSWGGTRVFGIIALSVFLIAEVVRVILIAIGAPPFDILRSSLLLPFAWMLSEGIKPDRPAAGPAS